MEAMDGPSRHQHHPSLSHNHSNQDKRYRCCETSAGVTTEMASGANAESRVGMLQHHKPQEEQDAELQHGDQSSKPHEIQPIPRPAVTRYRRQGDSEARLRTQQQRNRMKQQREAERAQQEREQHAKMTKEAEGEREDSMLARSASTESGFHTHTDRAEGDDIPVMMSLEPEAQRESEDDANSYSLPLRPEAEEYTESAEAEQQHLHSHPNYALQFLMLPRESLLNIQNSQREDKAEETLNGGYSNCVYTQSYSQSGARTCVSSSQDLESLDAGLEAYSEPYDTYSLSEHVYEEICDAPTSVSTSASVANDRESRQQAATGLQLLQSGAGKGDYHQQEAVGSRLRHYDERSDGESDSPEKEAEFAPYPRVDSCDQEDDTDNSVNGAKKGSQSFDPAAKDSTDKEEKRQPDKFSHKSNKTASRGKSAKQQAETPVKEPVRNSVEKRDAISLAIKDIKEAIEEVKNRTVRSPYTPDEPKEPVWVMRQDLSPTAECDLPTSLGADVSTKALTVIHQVILSSINCSLDVNETRASGTNRVDLPFTFNMSNLTFFDQSLLMR